MIENDESGFEKKICEEANKRKKYVEEADELIESIKQHYNSVRENAECVDIERSVLLPELADSIRRKDVKKLEELMERMER